MWGKYIYGIIETSEVYPHTKIFGVGVYTIPHKDISAVVSDSPFVDYTTLPKDQIARYLLRHQQIIEKIMDSYTSIPMRLGTYAFNIREVEEILSIGYPKFKDIFMKINNKIELDVVATWSDLNSVIKEIGEVKEIKELKEKLMSKHEAISREDQMKVGRLIKNILSKEGEKLAMEIEITLRKCSISSKRHELMDDRMIFNGAFLIEKSRKDEFEGILDELNNRFGERINFRCIGPLPFYSFYTIETKKLSFEDVDWARQKLCLGNMVTKEEIIKAYKNGTKLYHPDKDLDNPNAERQFNEINMAYKILLEYCQGDLCSFNKKDFNQDAIIIKIRE